MNRIFSTAFLCLALITVSGTSRAQNDSEEGLNIEAQPLASALREFSEQTGLQIGYAAELTKGKEAAGVKGVSDPETALETLLESSGLEHRFINESTVIVRAVAVAAEPGGDGDAKKPQQTVAQMAQAAVANEHTGSDGDSADSADEEAVPSDFEEIVVTGSKLVDDPGKLTRQITIFNRAEIERSGATRLDDFLSRLPQNLNAPNNVGSGIQGQPSAFGLGENVFAGSSINLRGLGAQYTLILIDGRRPARGGQFGTVTDISNIPIDSVERIEILFDGAAAIYGADAIGGVVNIITRRDYEGRTTVSATYSNTDEGGGGRYNVHLAHRLLNWESGSLTASVSYQTQKPIDGSQRQGIGLENSDFGVLDEDLILRPSANGNIRGQVQAAFVDGQIVVSGYAPLMWVNGDQRLSGGVEVPVLRQVWNGSDFDLVETTTIVDRQNPVLQPGMFWIDEAAHRPQNPETLGFTPVFQADLPEYGGQPLGLADISVSNELGANPFVPFQGQAISPEDETYTFALNFDQDFSDDLSMNLSLSYGDTYKASNQSFSDVGRHTITAGSPNNPFLRDFEFAFQDVFPQQFQEVSVKSYSANGGIHWDFTDHWSLVFGFGMSETKSDSDTTNFLRRSGAGPDTLNARIQGFVPGSDPRELTGSNFNDPLLGYGSVDEMLAALVVPFMHTHNYATSYDADIRLVGKLFALPGGDVRSSLSLRYRENESEIFHNNPRVGNGDTSHLGNGSTYDDVLDDSVTGLGAEVSVPVFGNDFKLPFVDHLLLSLAGSLEESSNVEGTAFNWAVGFNWGLSRDFVVRLNRTYSVRLPPSVYTAREPRWNVRSFYDLYESIDSVSRVRVDETNWRISDGADHLTPEQNYGTALSFIYRPSFAKGLDIQLSISESETVDQIGTPYMASEWTAETVSPEAVLSNPLFAYADPVNNPVHAAAIGGLWDLETGELVSQVEISPGDLVFDGRHHNIGSTFNRGADLQVRYNLKTGFGDWMLTWRHQYLDVNEITRSNLCDRVVETACHYNGDEQGIDRGYGEPIDIVGSVSRESFGGRVFPLPRNSGSIELHWGYRGLGVSLSTRYQETTSIFKTTTRAERVIVDYIDFNGVQIPIFEEQVFTNILREDTRPARSLENLRISYDFGNGTLFKAPRGLRNARLWLSIAEVYRGEPKRTVTYLQQEYEGLEAMDINRLSINPRGRAYSLGFNASF